jgi:phosphomannomutase
MVSSLANSGKRGVVVINQMTSQMTEVVALNTPGITVQRSKVGEANVVAMMKQTQAFFGGEGSGGLVDPTVHYGRDSLIGVVHLINLLRSTDQTISQLVASLPNFVLTKNRYPIESKDALPEMYAKIEKWIKDNHESVEIDMRDGFRASWANTWIQVRPSNTEPILRLFVEAKNQADVNATLIPLSEIITTAS